ncbi:unnamed protein product [Macrosiphum euphorbiae]|uniref:Uncharacterized protein n=1 Tax=Macrosiphum euphorbiae TaxID=13131 RepID=A0AAV0XYW0_9HEMI|nr:unnamed protein product [Macrosiphum euphorbiae]
MRTIFGHGQTRVNGKTEKRDKRYSGKNSYRRTTLSGNDCLFIYYYSTRADYTNGRAAQWRTIFGNGQTRANGKTKERERLEHARVADQTAGGVSSVAVVMLNSTMTTVLLHNVTKTTSDRHYRSYETRTRPLGGVRSIQQAGAATCDYLLQVPRSWRSYNNGVCETTLGSNHEPADYRRGRTGIDRILWLEGGRGTVSNDVSTLPPYSPVLIGRRKVQLSHCRLR